MRKFILLSICSVSQTIYAQIGCNNWLQTPSVPSYVKIGQLNITGNVVTVEAVINRTAPYSGGQVWAGDVVSKHRDPNDVNYLLRPNSGEITTSNGYFKTPDIADIELNKTYHIAMVYDGSSLKFYRDGCLMSQVAASGNLVQNSWETSIGYYSPELYPNENFIGFINEVRIWNRARTQAEIRAYMNTALPTPATQTGLLAYYTFNDLTNKQGNPNWNGILGGNASINQTNSSCNPISDLCAPLSNDSIIINEYTEVLNLDVCKNELVVADASKFNIGDTVLIIQMKGAVIDSSNTANFGTVTDYRNSGNYEFNIIKQKNGNTLSLLNVLERQYDIADGKVQLIRVPYYKSINITSTLTCLPWDGSKGGVLAFNVEGNVNMLADIDVSGKGFSAGLAMGNRNATFNQQEYYYGPSSNNGAEKGEGIHTISTNKNYGRGAPSNGGGGGNAHNTGGGGGANGGMGGNGGDQRIGKKTITEQVGGKGGHALINSSSLNKLYAGGGGGMGHANDLFEYPAGNGGGIVILTSGSLSGNNFSIKANGGNGTEAPSSALADDGVGGGGGGGTILLDIPDLTGSVILEAKGGKGANHIANNVLQGPGGGGGGGVIALGQPVTSPQYTLNLSGGINGVNINLADNPWGATPGSNGVVLNNFKPVFDRIIFKKNIDSIRFNESNHDCNHFDFEGFGFTQMSSINFWNWNFGDGSTSNSQNTTHTFARAGAYGVKLIATDINGCKDSISKPVTIKNIDVTKSKDTSLCGSSAVNIFATGGSLYSWSPTTGLDNPNSSSTVATPLVSTKYYVTVTNTDGCSKKDSVNILVNSLPLISKSNDTSICNNTPVSLSAGGGISYTWSPAVSLNNPNIANPVATPATNTTYVVKVTNVDGCSKTDSMKVSINPIPTITKSNDTTICNKASVKLLISGGSSYLWAPASSLDDPTSATPLASPLSTTLYRVSIIDANSCVYNDSIKISVREAAVFSVSPDSFVCSKTPRQLTASGCTTYSWSPASFLDNPNISNPVSTPDTSIIYSVTIKENVCNESTTLFTKLTALPLPVVVASKSNDITCSFPSSHLTAKGAQDYNWTPANSLDNPAISNPIATPTVSTTYLVTGKDLNGCAGTDTIEIKASPYANVIYELPNSFTPNGDGKNDCFGIAYWGMVQELDFSIYNRFGEKVFHTNDISVCWDGKYKGQLQDANAFIYIVKAKSACGIIERKGTVMLLK
jgi:gliding motility-associated-like protein